MFTKEESKRIRQEFWTSFGKEYPHKWLLYNTKMKEIQLKFTFTRKFAQVSLDIIASDELIRAYYFEKITSLKNILKNEHLPEAIFEENYQLPEGKKISRVYEQLDNVSIHNKKDWPEVQAFLFSKMKPLEEFFLEYRDYIKD